MTLLAVFVLKPSPEGHGTHTQLGLPACGSVAFFGRPCPGCGLTTSWTATLHGQLDTAFRAHALGTFLYLVFTFSAFACLMGYITQRRFNDRYRPVAVMFALSLFSLVIYGVIRFFLVKYPGQGALL